MEKKTPLAKQMANHFSRVLKLRLEASRTCGRGGGSGRVLLLDESPGHTSRIHVADATQAAGGRPDDAGSRSRRPPRDSDSRTSDTNTGERETVTR